MTYSSEVLADAPWGFWPGTPSGSVLSDASPNGRNLTIAGPAVTAADGPDGSTGTAVRWSNNGADSAVSMSTSSATLEAFVKLSSLPGGNMPIITAGTGGGYDKQLYIRADGLVAFYIFTGTALTVVSTSALAVGQWHHIVASVGPAGTKIRVSKVTIGQDAATTSWTGGQPVHVHSGINLGDTTPVSIWGPAFYTSQLSDARTDAHYDAALVGLPVGASLSGAAPTVTGSFALTATTPPPDLTLTGTAPGVMGAFSASVAVAPASADLAGTAPKVVGSFTLAQTGVGIVDLAGTAPGVFASFNVTASGAPVEVATDAVNRANGMTLVTEWQVEVDPPVTEPTRQRAHDYAIAVSLTEPTLEDGRPT